MKAMMGAGMDPHTLQLLDEIRTLRSRVDELEHALDAADAARIEAEADVEVDVRTGVLEGAGKR